MKRLLGFIVIAIILAACNVCLSQIPDQLVFVDANCEALLPDYAPDVIVIDNCDNATITQVPAPGTLLTSTQPITNVVMTASDISGNSNSINFNVILVDTIAPTIQAGPGLLSYNLDNYGTIHSLYHAGIVAMYDSAYVRYPENFDTTDITYQTDNLVTISNLNSRYTVSSFTNPDWLMFAVDSTYAADTLGMSLTEFRIEFVALEE